MHVRSMPVMGCQSVVSAWCGRPTNLHVRVCMRVCPQGEGGAMAGAVLAVAAGLGPNSRAGTPGTPPVHTASTPQVTRRDPAVRRLPGGVPGRRCREKDVRRPRVC